MTSLSHEDIQKLQRPRESGEVQSEFLLINDLPRAWQHICTLDAARVDIVLDNSAFELVCDLVFCDCECASSGRLRRADRLRPKGLVTSTPHVAEVVFHPKDTPSWFVSDVIPADVVDTLGHLHDRSFFPDLPPAQADLIHDMAVRWRSHFDKGIWRLSVPLDLPIGELFPEKDQCQRLLSPSYVRAETAAQSGPIRCLSGTLSNAARRCSGTSPNRAWSSSKSACFLLRARSGV